MGKVSYSLTSQLTVDFLRLTHRVPFPSQYETKLHRYRRRTHQTRRTPQQRTAKPLHA
jgi:hypothetical protein